MIGKLGTHAAFALLETRRAERAAAPEASGTARFVLPAEPDAGSRVEGREQVRPPKKRAEQGPERSEHAVPEHATPERTDARDPVPSDVLTTVGPTPEATAEDGALGAIGAIGAIGAVGATDAANAAQESQTSVLVRAAEGGAWSLWPAPGGSHSETVNLACSTGGGTPERAQSQVAARAPATLAAIIAQTRERQPTGDNVRRPLAATDRASPTTPLARDTLATPAATPAQADAPAATPADARAAPVVLPPAPASAAPAIPAAVLAAAIESLARSQPANAPSDHDDEGDGDGDGGLSLDLQTPELTFRGDAPSAGLTAAPGKVVPLAPSASVGEQVADAVRSLIAEGTAPDGVIRFHGAAIGSFSVEVQHDHAGLMLQLAADNPLTRAALAERLPELRAALERAGFALAETSVGADAQRQGHTSRYAAAGDRDADLDPVTPRRRTASLRTGEERATFARDTSDTTDPGEAHLSLVI